MPEEPSKSQVTEPVVETWGKATVIFLAQTQTIKATFTGKNATFVGKNKAECQEFLPEMHRKTVIDKRKSVQVNVEVKFIGGNHYRLLRILDASDS